MKNRTTLTVERRSVMAGAKEPTNLVHLRMPDNTERTLPVAVRQRLSVPAAVELRGEGSARRIYGEASVYGPRSLDLGGYVEVIARGAFRKVLATNPDVHVLFNHNSDLVLGRTKNGTARLIDSPTALSYEAIPPNTQYARDVLELLDRGDVDQSSFAFMIGRDRWELLPDGTVLCTILEVSALFDVSPVTMGAYPDTTSGARSDAAAEREAREHEAFTKRKAAIRLRAAKALADARS